MPMPPEVPKWIAPVAEVVALHPTWGVRRVCNELKEKHGNEVPSERTIGRVLKVVRQLPEQERRQYGYVRWPDTFESGDLPWEAAPITLEFIRDTHRYESRPTVRQVKWFWRLTVSAPDLPEEDRYVLSTSLAAMEVGVPEGRDAKFLRDVEFFLAYAPWQGEEALRAYLQGVIRALIGGQGSEFFMPISNTVLLADKGKYRDAQAERYPPQFVQNMPEEPPKWPYLFNIWTMSEVQRAWAEPVSNYFMPRVALLGERWHVAPGGHENPPAPEEYQALVEETINLWKRMKENRTAEEGDAHGTQESE